MGSEDKLLSTLLALCVLPYMIVAVFFALLLKQ